MSVVADWSGLCTIHRDNVEEARKQLLLLSGKVQVPDGVCAQDWIAGAQYAFGVGVSMLGIILEESPPR